jgi:hypothetical protein
VNYLIPASKQASTAPSVQIEPAYDCDGSICHQPLFDEDGGLHYVAPHCHLIEFCGTGPIHHAVFCDFPSMTSKL